MLLLYHVSRSQSYKNSHKQAPLPKPKSFLLFHIQGEENLKTALKLPHILLAL